MEGGDNATESEASRAKGQLRRTNLLGRGSPKFSHVHVLASGRVLAKPGLAAVLDAMIVVRDARPASVLKLEQDAAWLSERAKRDSQLQKPH